MYPCSCGTWATGLHYNLTWVNVKNMFSLLYRYEVAEQPVPIAVTWSKNNVTWTIRSAAANSVRMVYSRCLTEFPRRITAFSNTAGCFFEVKQMLRKIYLHRYRRYLSTTICHWVYCIECVSMYKSVWEIADRRRWALLFLCGVRLALLPQVLG